MVGSHLHSTNYLHVQFLDQFEMTSFLKGKGRDRVYYEFIRSYVVRKIVIFLDRKAGKKWL